MDEPPHLTLKQRIATKAVRWQQKIAVRKAKKEIAKLYQKHQHLIEALNDQIANLVMLETGNKAMSMVAIICANALSGFETQQEMELTQEMIKETMKAFNKENRTPK